MSASRDMRDWNPLLGVGKELAMGLFGQQGSEQGQPYSGIP